MIMPVIDCDAIYRATETAKKVLDIQPEDVVIGVMNGAFRLVADITSGSACYIDFLRVASYENNERVSEPRLLCDIETDIKGKRVIVVEDIIDSGKTIQFVLDHLRKKNPEHLDLVAFCGRMIPEGTRNHLYLFDELVEYDYIFGHGMDNKGRQRGYNDIWAL